MNPGPSISVALGTYNGEQFLSEQLASLAAQTHRPHELVVCDDGSMDTTCEIVESFARAAPFPVRLFRNPQNLGYPDNFLRAASLCEGDWVAFCDQDDVWLPHKLKAAADAIAAAPGTLAVLQNAIIAGAGLDHAGRLFPGRLPEGRYGPLDQHGFWVWPGFLITASREMFTRLDLSQRPESYIAERKVQAHDRWVCMIANALGGVVVLGDAAALYRRHERALSGANAEEPLAERVRQAQAIGERHYRRLATVAESAADYLERIAGEESRAGWAERFRAGAAAFRGLAVIQDRRARLYGASGLPARLAAYLAVWSAGGYIGRPFSALGPRSAAKDAAFAMLGGQMLKVEPDESRDGRRAG